MVYTETRNSVGFLTHWVSVYQYQCKKIFYLEGKNSSLLHLMIHLGLG